MAGRPLCKASDWILGSRRPGLSGLRCEGPRAVRDPDRPANEGECSLEEEEPGRALAGGVWGEEEGEEVAAGGVRSWRALLGADTTPRLLPGWALHTTRLLL